jgi:hypothetical protein
MHEHIEMLKSQVFIRHWCQLHSGIYFTRVYNVLSYAAILINLTSFVNISNIDDGNKIVHLVFTSIPILSALIIAVIRHVQPSEKAQAYFANARFYDELMMEINMKRTTCGGDMEAFTTRVTSDFLSRNKLYVEPPQFVVNSFKRRFGDATSIAYLEEVKVVFDRAQKAEQHESAIKEERALHRMESSRSMRKHPSIRRSKSEHMAQFDAIELPTERSKSAPAPVAAGIEDTSMFRSFSFTNALFDSSPEEPSIANNITPKLR